MSRCRRSAVVGHRADGLRDGPRPGARRASTLVALQPDAATGPTRSPTELGARVVGDAGRGGRGGGRRDHDARRRRRRRSAVYGGPDGLLDGAPPGRRARRHEHRPPGHDPWRSRPRRPGRGRRASSTRPCQRQRRARRGRPADADGRRRRPRTSSARGRRSRRSRRRSSTSGRSGTGAAMKLAVNAVIFGLNGALSEGLVLAEAAGIDRARRLRRPRRERRRGAVRRLQARRVPRPGGDARRVLARPRRQGPRG